MRSGWLRVAWVLVPVLVLVVLGCSDDDDKSTTPDNGNEVLTPAEFTEEMQEVTTGATSGLMECKAGFLIDPIANADLFEFLQSEILPEVAGGGNPSEYYGTWDDTSPARDDGEGITRTATTPTDAVRLMLVGADTLGTPLNGDLTLEDVAIVVDTLNGVFEVAFGAALHEYTTGDEAQVTLDLELVSDPQGSGELEDVTVDLASSGSICDVEYDLDAALQDGAVTLSGWYQGQIKVTYDVAVTMTETDTTATATVSFGTTTPPRVRVMLAVNPDAPADCVTGSVYVRGTKQADIVATGCGTEDVVAYMVVDGDSLLAEEVLGDLWDQIEGLIGNGEEFSLTGLAGPALAYNPCAGFTAARGFPPALRASVGPRSPRLPEAAREMPRGRVHPRD